MQGQSRTSPPREPKGHPDTPFHKGVRCLYRFVSSALAEKKEISRPITGNTVSPGGEVTKRRAPSRPPDHMKTKKDMLFALFDAMAGPQGGQLMKKPV